MKKFLLLLGITFISISALGQAPSGNYGEFKYSYSFDSNGNVVDHYAFPRINPNVVTTNFGFVQSNAYFLYYGLGGTWQPSQTYNWAGYQNGWYVYSCNAGLSYGYLLISSDYKSVRLQDISSGGIVDVYEPCDPNERMNNAPTR